MSRLNCCFKCSMEMIFISFRMADSTWLENKRLYKPILYQFCIANNEVETRFRPLSCLKQWTKKSNQMTPIVSPTSSHSKPSFQPIFYNYKSIVQIRINLRPCKAFVEQYIYHFNNAHCIYRRAMLYLMQCYSNACNRKTILLRYEFS